MTNGAIVGCIFFLSPYQEMEFISTTMPRNAQSEVDCIISYGMRWKTNEVFRISTDEGFFTAIRRTFEGPLVAPTNTSFLTWQSWTGTNAPTRLPNPSRPTSTVGPQPVSSPIINRVAPPMPGGNK